MFGPPPAEPAELQLRDYQEAALEKLRDGLRRGVRRQMLCLGTGGGKCLAPETRVLTYGGYRCRADQLQPGAALMGPDGTPRYVTSVSRGYGPMVEVVPTKGEPWRCNDVHILTLVHTVTGAVIDVSISEWMEWPEKRRHVYKLFRVPVDFPEWAAPDLPVPPYILGVLLGDGSLVRGSPSVTTVDREIVHELQAYAAAAGVHLRADDNRNRPPSYHLTTGRIGGKENPVTAALRSLYLMGESSHSKHIPDQYMLASRRDRLELLAGLIDTDGSLGRTGFDYVSASHDLASGVAFVARSLGLAAYVATKLVPYRGQKREYHRVSISGHTDIVPTRIPRKRAPARRQKKDVLRTGFQLVHVGDGDYCGFTLTGDGRFLLDDFTVTHNTIVAAALMKAATEKGKRAAFVADRITLVDQTSTRLREAGIDHGVAQGQNRWGYENPVHVWSSQTLERAFQHRDVLADYDLLVIDEAHIVRRLVVEKMIESDIPTVGLSATPFTKGLGDIYQALVNVRTTDQLVADKWLVPFRIFVGVAIDMKGAKLQGGEWSDAEVSNRTLPVIGDIVAEWREKTHEVFGEGRNPKTLVFSASVANGQEICRAFGDIGIMAEQISYRDRDDEERRAKIRRFEGGETDVLTAVDALSKGFDVPMVECIVMARPFRRSLSQIIQQLGRGMRIADDKEPFCLLLDAARNYLRFADRIESFWANGLPNLHSKTLEKQREPSTREAEERVCPECGFVWPKGADMCPSCGHKPARKAGEATQPGTLVEYKRSGIKRDIWPDCCAYARDRYPDDQQRATKLALAQHKNIMGRFPSGGRSFEPADSCSPEIAAMIRENIRKWVAQKKAIEKSQQRRRSA